MTEPTPSGPTYTPPEASSYTLTEHPSTIVRGEDGAFIPTDPDNLDYQEYLAWCEEGNTAKAYTPPPAAKGSKIKGEVK